MRCSSFRPSALMFAIVGCKQLIRSRSRNGVDRDLWLLLGTYGAMLVLYVLFNCFSPNNRPILEDGVCGSSFPSSHTLLAVTMCGTAMIQAVQRIREGGLRTAALVICAAGMVGIIAARAMAGVHWATDILGGILLGAAPGGRLPHNSVRRLRQSLTRKARKALATNRREIRQPPLSSPRRTSSRNLYAQESLLFPEHRK